MAERGLSPALHAALQRMQRYAAADPLFSDMERRVNERLRSIEAERDRAEADRGRTTDSDRSRARRSTRDRPSRSR